MARLDNPKRKSLSKTDLEEYPVWVWDDEREHLQPITESDPSPDDYDTLFIRASFESGGYSFDGYLVGGPTFYAFALFIAEREFVLNLNLPDLMKKSLTEIFALLNCQPFKLFPIHFTSSVRFKGGSVIEGTLTP